MALSLEDIISGTPAGGMAALPAGEFEGPVTISKPIRLQGRNTTIWARHGSVIDITVPGVTIEGLRVEITEGAASEMAINAKCPANASDVEVLGGVSGFGREDGVWELPRTLSLGDMPAGGVSTFVMTVDIPTEARLVCSGSGISFQPENVPAGRSEVRLTVSGSGSPGLVYTEILVKSQFSRRIYLSGRFTAEACAVQDKRIFEAKAVERTSTVGAAKPVQAIQPQTAPSTAAPTDVITNVGAAPLDDKPLLSLTKGQRVPAAGYLSGEFDVSFTGRKLGSVDIDPYVFMLNDREQSPGDGYMVFFGNEVSTDGAVRYHPDDGRVSIDLSRVSPQIKRITVAYSVYSGDSRKNFSLVREPRISLCSQDRERVRFDIDGLTNEVTVVAVEFYIYKGEWRISAVGAGFRDGLAKLCNRYGIEVSG